MKRLLAVLGLVMPLLLTGCEREGPLEEAGEEVDQAMDEAGDRLERESDS